MKKHYFKIGSMLEEISTESATQAMQWHRSGDDIDVMILHDNGTRQHLAYIPGATQPEKPDENRKQCKHIAKELEAYADGDVHRCPECGEEIRMPNDVGDKFRCPHCHNVADFEEYEQLGVWDYMSDILDIEYRCSSDREYRSCKIMVACGGPNIYIDTAAALVKLYWWTEYAEYPISYEARDAVDEWAEEYWNI